MNFEHHFLNIPGWHTNKKIIVFESDDWGSIRMPSKKIWERLDQNPYLNVRDPYNLNDTLARVDDLESLFETLLNFRDKNGNPPAITANCLLANPDFKKIKESEFTTYFYEPLEQTFERYNNHEALHLWNEGIKAGVFIPQFHGREHVNVPFWVDNLRKGNPGVRYTFDFEVFGAGYKDLDLRKENFQAAWDFNTVQQEEYHLGSIAEGLKLFRDRFGINSITAAAPSYTWSDKIEKILFEKGVNAIQTIALQKKPVLNKKSYKRHFRFTNKNHKRIGYTQRNVFFEPTLDRNFSVSTVLKRIETAFACYKPAIVGCHRLNFIGTLHEKNRSSTLVFLNELLKQVLIRWPQVEFHTSSSLQKIIYDDN